jgi:hypothetical protein
MRAGLNPNPRVVTNGKAETPQNTPDNPLSHLACKPSMIVFLSAINPNDSTKSKIENVSSKHPPTSNSSSSSLVQRANHPTDILRAFVNGLVMSAVCAPSNLDNASSVTRGAGMQIM